MVERYQLEIEDEFDGALITFESKEAAIRFIQHELPSELIESDKYEIRTLH